MEDSEKNLDFATILDYVGGGGKWQWRKIIWLAPAHIAYSIPLLLHLFTAYAPSHRCFVQGCDSELNPDFHASFLNFSTPTDHASSTFLRDAEDYDPCRTYVQKSSGCHPRAFNPHLVQNCSKFVYDQSEFSATLTTKLDLVCDKVNVRHSLGSIMMFGLMTGSLIGGPLSDKIGRKNAILLSIIITVPCLIGGGFVQDFATYAVLRYINCTVIVFGWIGAQALKMEYFSREKRTFVMAMDAMIGQFANLALPAIAYFHRDWQSMHVVSGIVAFLALPSLILGVPESSRWLLSNNKSRKAENILQDVAKVNGKELSEDQWNQIRTILNQFQKVPKRTKKLNISDMFGTSLRKISLILIFNWVTGIVTKYALTLNVNALAGDIFTNYALTELVGVPGMLSAYYLMNKIGRQRSLTLFMFGQGFFALCLAFLPKSASILVLISFLLGNSCSSATNIVLWLYTAELYPTNLRSQSLGVCSTISRLFGMSSSYIGELARVWTPLPMVLLGTPSILAALAALQLPDTKGKSLPETMEEAYELNMKNTQYYSSTYEILD